ncbi:FAD-dependent oxidoreductase [Pseudomonas sp. Fl5BN2]|uniref:NAD(P)/FAD-dependent oxidoreductase n=1 Tax=unclassified Pseudomonas TaxID=196821 RepID=UPI0013783725|nr:MULTISPECIES: FAD-dependent oxidoreductase [unclassified Pseudomonas]NBF05751.1 FAD-dependent oxidoreductase [Pseudomonas sp. Fl5BN2]NBF07421.1 FAD-dependent oxidoreductase [Pseudomonas sp. Fl4BN1]
MNRTEHIQAEVAIIGSGPAGLAAAIELRRQGIGPVLVIEREGQAGGIPRHCAHPPFGMREYQRILSGPAYARRNVEAALKAGVVLLLRHTVVSLEPGGLLQLASPDGPLQIHAQKVLIATGARETPRSARLLSGDRPVGVINTGALQNFLYVQHLKPFERPLIIGTELVSLSAVLSCRRAGIRPVAVLEANTRATARWPLSLFPRVLGIPMHFGAQLLAINGTGRVESAQVRMANGEVRTLDCDGVLLSGQFTPESSLVRQSHLQLDSGSDGPKIDQFGRCSDPAYFAAGNLLRPIETAGWSYREGRRIGGLMALALSGQLPDTHNALTLKYAAPIKLGVPARLVRGDVPGLQHIQLRVSQAVSGTLRVRAHGKDLWSQPVSALPERRLLIPLKALKLPEHIDQLDICIE